MYSGIPRINGGRFFITTESSSGVSAVNVIPSLRILRTMSLWGLMSGAYPSRFSFGRPLFPGIKPGRMNRNDYLSMRRWYSFRHTVGRLVDMERDCRRSVAQ